MDIEKKINEVMMRQVAGTSLHEYVDWKMTIPKVYCPGDDIRLILLGQDPTVKNEKSRGKIEVVLNLDKNGSLRNYATKICDGLGIDLDKNVYATNFLKNFFVKPPTQFDDPDLFSCFSEVWLPLLTEELSQFDNVPVITLGQPVLSLVIQSGTPELVREYWGYNSEWKSGKTLEFKDIKPENNILRRQVFPFPHQPSISKQFYYKRLDDYLAFMRSEVINRSL